MGNRPQTLYGIADSPVGLAAWILDHDIRSYKLIARVFDGQTEGLTRDDILDNITLYWLTNTAISSARLYWENKLGFVSPKGVGIPAAVSVFPDEIYTVRGVGPRRLIQSSFTTTSSPKAGTSRPGNSRSSSSARCAPRSSRCASRRDDEDGARTARRSFLRRPIDQNRKGVPR